MENKTRLRLERVIFHASLSFLMALTFARLGISECRPQLHVPPGRMEWVEIFQRYYSTTLAERKSKDGWMEWKARNNII